MGTTPVTVALVDDYDIVVMGIEHILEQYQDRVVIAELDTNVSVSEMVDIVLYDSFAQPESPLRRHRAAGPAATRP
jgi:DNA-binding NarL/FixJ family response regulator